MTWLAEVKKENAEDVAHLEVAAEAAVVEADVEAAEAEVAAEAVEALEVAKVTNVTVADGRITHLLQSKQLAAWFLQNEND